MDLNEVGMGTFFKYMKCFAYYIIYWLKLIGKQHSSKYKEHNFFYNLLLSNPTSGTHSQENNSKVVKSNIYEHIHCSYHSRNTGNKYYYLFGIYYDTLHPRSLTIKKF